MRDSEEVDKARAVVCEAMRTVGLSEDQKLLLTGMSVALCWVAGIGGMTLELLVRGELMEPGKTISDAPHIPSYMKSDN